MSAIGPGDGAEAERAARAHARRIVGRDVKAREDLAPGADVVPPDLVDWLLSRTFHGFEVVAHARIGAHHIVKTMLLGPTTLVVQARWVAEADGRWRIREAEIARVEGEPDGVSRPAPPPGEA
jgi:hypothetical protein